MLSEYDVAIIGGGPAGSTAGTLLAQAGRKVVILEREKFPRFHIGESLLPYSLAAFDRLGVRERLDRWAVDKRGAEIATACGGRTVKFLFEHGFRLRHRRAYQVERATFDQMLLERAREVGAEVREQTTVERVEFGADSTTLRLVGGEEVRARYLLDASGRNAVVGQQLGLRKTLPNLRKFSCFAHYENVQRDCGVDGGLTRLVHAGKHWFWFIPLDDVRTSVGVVMDVDDFKAAKLSPAAMLESVIAASPVMSERMQNAGRLTEVHAIGDYSYRNARLTGPRWMLIGDAAGFIDPIFSTGVFLAIHSGEQCADVLNQVLDDPAKEARLFPRYEKALRSVMDKYLRFVTAWYRPEFIEVFTSPTQKFQLAPAVNAVLAGNLGSDFAIWWRMQLFYLIVFLQRFVALCPRLDGKPAAPTPSAA
jgi:flavin-dependent dehydrogenase